MGEGAARAQRLSVLVLWGGCERARVEIHVAGLGMLLAQSSNSASLRNVISCQVRKKRVYPTIDARSATPKQLTSG